MRNDRRWLCGLVVAVPLVVLSGASSFAEDLGGHLKGGEFVAAKRAARAVPAAERDAAMGQIALAQAYAGDVTSAAATARGIRDGGVRGQVIEGASGAGGSGGAAFADFDSLMQLIQTTVVPDTWEALGGPSTMFPYVQGIMVKPSGTVQEIETPVRDDAAANLLAALQVAPAPTGDPGTADAWRAPSALRCVSLRRLLDEVTARRMQRTAADDAIRHLAGISEIEFVLITATDVVLAGPVGGIDASEGWYRDRQSGRSPIRLDSLAACLASAVARLPFGCTIDPSQEGLQRAASVAQQVQQDRMPIGLAVDELKQALGQQRVGVFGTPPDSSLAYLLVEADRHMKRLALGDEPMPNGVLNYLDFVDASIQHGPPDELLLRLWFTTQPVTVQVDSAGNVFRLSGRPIRLSGENELALASGERGRVTRDFRTERFVDEFNRHFSAIRDRYPVYAALEGVFRAAAASELIFRQADASLRRDLLQGLALTARETFAGYTAPKQIDSIALMHVVRHGRKRYHMLIASGGVAVDGSATLVNKIEPYPALDSMASVATERPKAIQRWWWDAAAP